MSSQGVAIFVKKAPWVMALLMADFSWGLEDAAAAVGNLGHESDGLQAINEVNPTVAGSRGGFGWAQWTGPRRREFEAYCARNGLSPTSDRANYGFLFMELKGSERGAVSRTRNAVGLEAKVEAFELGYERAGIKHYPSREKWAERALTAWASASDDDKTAPWLRGAPGAPLPAPVPVPTPRPDPEDANQGKSPVEKVIGAGKGAAGGAAAGAVLSAAIVSVFTAYGLVPEGMDGAAFGALVTGIVSSTTTAISAMVGTYMAKRNAT